MTTAGQFDIAITAGGGGVRLRLRGELDLAVVGSLDRIVEIADGTNLSFVVDCGGLTFIDVAGVAGLQRAVARGATLAQVHGTVHRVLELLGLLEDLVAPPASAVQHRRAS